jgi:hypothetical protein
MTARRRNILLCVLGVWLVVMLVLSPQFITAHRATKDVERVFAEYTDSLVNKRFDDVYRQCGRDFQTALSYDEFVRVYELMEEENGPLKSIRRVGYKIHGNGTPTIWRAVIDADLIYEKKSVRFAFCKEGERSVLFGAEQL